jgi:hypothetical protein
MEGKRDTGARVNQGGKIKWIELLNKLHNYIFKSNDKYYNTATTSDISQPSIGVLVEFIMRQYSSNNTDTTTDKLMFLTTEQTFLNKILEK